LKKVSIVVPCFNSEKYLNRCVDHLINQNYANLEIILVNDGSTDTTFDIIENYIKIDDRVIGIHKKNGGIGSAYRSAFDICTGDYITFIDSDDWFELNAVEETVKIAEAHNADIVFFNISLRNEFGCEFRVIPEIEKYEVISGVNNILEYFYTRISDPTLFRLYNIKLLKNITLFDQNIGIDELLTPQFLMSSRNIACLPSKLCNIFWRENSVSKSTLSETKYLQMKEVYAFLISFCELNFTTQKYFYREKYLSILINLYKQLISNEISIGHEFEKRIYADYKWAYKFSMITESATFSKSTFNYFIFYISPRIFILLANTYSKLKRRIHEF
jgi:glycosyltransferase involved in cell wall biosynthesis